MLGACEICGNSRWTQIYRGPIRAGAFGNVGDTALIGRCDECGADRLDEQYCINEDEYASDTYRRRVGQTPDPESQHALHDELAIFTLQAIWPLNVRHKTVADIGCGAGSFLDHVRGIAGRVIAVEPSAIYHDHLRDRGYGVYSYAADAKRDLAGQVDVAFAIQVIEHVRNPREFLRDICVLLSPTGCLVVSTPNRRDVLMEILPAEFQAFFYRAAHRWYFDAASLARCAELSDFEAEKPRYVHRYGLSNTLLWMRDRRPGGRAVLDPVSPDIDKTWQAHLNATGRSDCLYMVLRPKANAAS